MASHLPSSSLCVWSDVRFLKRKVNLRPIVRNSHGKPFPAEVSRTILELSSVGTLSTPTQDGWPLGIAVPFAVDPHGTPLLFLNHSTSNFALNSKSSFLVQVSLSISLSLLLCFSSSSPLTLDLFTQLQQYGLRTPQCTIQGTLQKPTALKVSPFLLLKLITNLLLHS